MREIHRVPDGSVDLVLADPPYGIAYKDTSGRTIENDSRPYIWWLDHAFRATAKVGALLCFCRWDVQDVFKIAIETAGWRVRSQIIWVKPGAGGQGDCKAQFMAEHEVAWFATKGRYAFPAGRPSSVAQIRRVRHEDRTHPCEKPVELLEQMITVTTARGMVVLDPFMGTGATGVACAHLKRSFIGIEMDESYIAVARKRIQNAREGWDLLPFEA